MLKYPFALAVLYLSWYCTPNVFLVQNECFMQKTEVMQKDSLKKHFKGILRFIFHMFTG